MMCAVVVACKGICTRKHIYILIDHSLLFNDNSLIFIIKHRTPERKP